MATAKKTKEPRRCKVTGNILPPKSNAPPLGNQYALGNNGGRPVEYDKSAIAKKMVDWAKQEDSININKFCAYNDLPSRTFLEWVSADTEFSRAYDLVKTHLAFRREERLNSGELHVKAYDLNATVYDQFTRAEKISMDDMDAERKKKVAEVSTESLSKMLKCSSDQIKQE